MTQTGVDRMLPRIGLVSSDALRALGLRAILQDGEKYALVRLEGDAAETLAHDARTLRAVVIDASTIQNLFELIRMFHGLQPDTGLLVLGAEKDLGYVERIIGAGARGYLNLAANETEVRMALDVVLDGSIWAPRKVLAHLLQSARTDSIDARGGAVRLTRREREVLKLLVLGQPNREIAEALGVDEGTIKAHMGRLMRKAGVDNRTALSMRALGVGLGGSSGELASKYTWLRY